MLRRAGGISGPLFVIPGVISWASRPDLAHKAANTYARPTRRTTVSPVDP
ncbi:hypothetical protein PUN71_019005 [Arthrobacter sp. NQ7]|nr:hypothetical protein [Arthrobacter sp. NQ7]MDJ0459298.1 hypothetical protein [Arthrobacter sp. NQ7]